MDIKGLRVGGGGRVTLGKQHIGVLMFMGGDKDMDIKRYKAYRDKILIPIVQQIRKDFHGWTDRDHIPSDLSAVSWSDGDLAQIENIINEELLAIYQANLITDCKQNPQQTGTEQLADLTKIFLIKQKL